MPESARVTRLMNEINNLMATKFEMEQKLQGEIASYVSIISRIQNSIEFIKNLTTGAAVDSSNVYLPLHEMLVVHPFHGE